MWHYMTSISDEGAITQSSKVLSFTYWNANFLSYVPSMTCNIYQKLQIFDLC